MHEILPLPLKATHCVVHVFRICLRKPVRFSAVFPGADGEISPGGATADPEGPVDMDSPEDEEQKNLYLFQVQSYFIGLTACSHGGEHLLVHAVTRVLVQHTIPLSDKITKVQQLCSKPHLVKKGLNKV